MAKNLMANDPFDARAAGLLNSTVQIELSQRRMSRSIPSNRPIRAYIHQSPRYIENDLQIKVAQIGKKDTFILGAIITSRDEVFHDCASDTVVEISMLGNMTRKTDENKDTLQQTGGS
jgi:hypothetical protein